MLTTNTDYYYLLLGLLTLVIFATWQIIRSDIGRSFQAIREDETAALAMGVNVTYYKLLAFAIGAFFAGIAARCWRTSSPSSGRTALRWTRACWCSRW